MVCELWGPVELLDAQGDAFWPWKVNAVTWHVSPPGVKGELVSLAELFWEATLLPALGQDCGGGGHTSPWVCFVPLNSTH